MKDRNFVKEIEKLRTAVLGYDREEVVLYIRELVEYYGQKNEEAVRELYLEKMQLAAENAGLRAQIPTQEKLYAEAEGKAEEILAEARAADGCYPDKDKGESGEATGALPSVPQPSGSLEKRPGLHLCRVSAGGRHTGSAWKAAEAGTDIRKTDRKRPVSREQP